MSFCGLCKQEAIDRKCKKCKRKLCQDCQLTMLVVYGGKRYPIKCYACTGKYNEKDLDQLAIVKENKRLELEVISLKKTLKEFDTTVKEALYGENKCNIPNL